VFIGDDPKIRRAIKLANLVAATDATVIITGETGTGKELIARSLHLQSTRRNRPLVSVNCGALNESILESELFGHVKGAFTGADHSRVGKFEAAHGGTIFLDELAEMKPPFQVALLRILQSGEYIPVGLSESRYCDVRVIAATNRNLGHLVESGAFRPDLYYRLNVICIELPPLRERRSDISRLIDHFLQVFGEEYGKGSIKLEPDAREVLLAYHYPGNVRELENLIRRAVILSEDGAVTLELLPRELVEPAGHGAIRPAREPSVQPCSTLAGFHEARDQALKAFEQAYLTTALRENCGIVSRAARRTKLSERNFHKKLSLYGIDFRAFRA
jgi:transcriptional regulator with GAF, ATPase, and Fis domain